MRKITKLLTLALAALMIMSVVPVSAAFEDVSVDDKALTEAVELLSTLGVVKGTSETEFSPEKLVTREQMAAFIYRLMKAGRSSEGGVNNTAFTDLEDSTFFNMISWANTAGVIKGTSATTFNPKGNITLQDAYVMVVRALGYEKDEQFIYPFGYTDKAEALGLDEDVPSTINYTDNLTRGDVAIILANAFFADMNEKTVEYKWVYNTDDGTATGTPLVSGQPIEATYVAKETVHTIATKVFGIVEETLFVEATTHYAYGATPLASETRDYDAVYGVRYDEDGNKVANATEYKMEDIKLAGASDDYFLASLTFYVKKDEDGNVADDEIIATKSSLVKKTVTADEVVIERSAKTDKEYYVNEDKKEDKVMTGLITLGGIKAYIDENNAPISYSKDNDSVQFIALNGGAYDEEDAVFTYGNTKNYTGVYDATDRDALTTAFAGDFKAVYYNGFYEADVYDIDNDGYAEFIFVKPYRFFQILDKNAVNFNGVQVTNGLGKVYTKKATVEGTYESEDYVLGYVNKAANYVKVVETVEPTTATIASKAEVTNKYQKITLDDGTVLNTYKANLKYPSYNTAYTYGSFTAGKSLTAFVKDDIILYVPNATVGADFDVAADYAIVLPDADGAWFKTMPSIVDGESIDAYYVRALVDGAPKWIKLAKTAHYDANDGKGVKSQKINSKATAQAAVNAVSANRTNFFTYTKSDDAYILKVVDYATWNSAAFANGATEEARAAFADVKNAFNLSTFTGAIYNVFENGNGTTTPNGQFKLQDYSKIIIRSYDNVAKEDVYSVYTLETLPKFTKTQFATGKVVLINNPKSTIEDLAIAYFDIGTGDFASKAAKEYRIVLGTSSVATADGVEILHTLLNIKDGTVTEGVVVDNDPTAAVAGYVVLTEEGKIKSAVTPGAYTQNTLFAGAFNGYDAANSLIQIGSDKYAVAADATVLIYIDADTYLVADTEALTEDVEEIVYEELKNQVNENANTVLNIKAIGVNGDSSDDLNIINTIVVELDASVRV